MNGKKGKPWVKEKEEVVVLVVEVEDSFHSTNCWTPVRLQGLFFSFTFPPPDSFFFCPCVTQLPAPSLFSLLLLLLLLFVYDIHTFTKSRLLLRLGCRRSRTACVCFEFHLGRCRSPLKLEEDENGFDHTIFYSFQNYEGAFSFFSSLPDHCTDRLLLLLLLLLRKRISCPRVV